MNTLHLILVNHLQSIVIDVLFVYQFDVLGQSIIQCQVQHIALALNHLRLVQDGHLFVADHGQQSCPFAIRQFDVVQQLQLVAQVTKQTFLVFHDYIHITLPHQLVYQVVLQFRLALISLCSFRHHVVVCHHRLVLLFYYDFIVVHRRKF